jgi:hypothetical protein
LLTRASKRALWRLCTIALFCAASGARAETPKSDLQVFTKLVTEYRSFPEEFFKKVSPDPRTQPDPDPAGIANLSESVLKARYAYYNATYLGFLKREKFLEKQLKSLKARMDKTPLSDFKNRSELEVKTAAAKADYDKTRLGLFLWSLDANSNAREALKTLPPDKRVAGKKAAPLPKLPGVFGGSSDDRKKLKDWEKPNLTPVDPEFYQTQLGKKLEKDLGGRADYWSYDYNSDELYVKVGDALGKLRVKQEGKDVRFMQTRVGPTFTEPRGSDTKVDMLTAQGRFLTGSKEEETLFGKYPKKGPELLEEGGSHASGDSRDH